MNTSGRRTGRVHPRPARIAALSGLLLALGLGSAARADAFVYWTNGNGNTIGRANLDGSSATQSFIGGAIRPDGVAVDGGHVYWTNFNASFNPGNIGRASLDGTGANQSFLSGASNPAGVAVDAGHVYWANYYSHTIGRANLDGTGTNQSFITGAQSPDGVAVDAGHVYWANGSANTIGRANLDGTGTNQSFITGANGPTGVAVDGGHVYWTNFGAGAIGRANLDGTGVNQRFITGLNGPHGVAVDASHVYWANYYTNTIWRANLDSTSPQSIISGASAPLDVAVDPPASARFWLINSTPNSVKNSELHGVSCTSAQACVAVGGFRDGTGTKVPLSMTLSSAGWGVQFPPSPPGATAAVMSGVSCTSTSACTAVGNTNGQFGFALAERWNGSSWMIDTPATPSGATQSDLTGVSCASAIACTAVGRSVNNGVGAPLAERWNGSTWTIDTPPTPSGSTDAFLTGVSCTSATACIAVGSYVTSAGGFLLAELWSGASWTAQTPPTPVGARLTGVSCTSASACMAVGYYAPSPGASVPLAERWNGSSWQVQAAPNPTATSQSTLNGVSCTSAVACTAVGDYFDRSSTISTLAERWDGSSWTLEFPGDPNGARSSFLDGVSCTSTSGCIAVGNYVDSTNVSLMLAEGSFDVSVFGPLPSAWTLTAAGPVGKGAIIHPVLKKPRLIGLAVFKLPKRTLVGFVPLGRHSGSKQRIRWNLKVNGKRLANGTYEVDLKIFTGAGKPTNLRGPRPERLVIHNGRVRVSRL
jgi:sugar lactone lactonase YvrE